VADNSCKYWPSVRESLRSTPSGEAIDWLRQHLLECVSCNQSALEQCQSSAEFKNPKSDPELLLFKSGQGTVVAEGGGWLSAFIDAAEANSYRPMGSDAQRLPRFVKPAQAPGEIGRFGAYPILDLLFTDAHGSVLLAEDAVHRRVTLHVLHPDLAANERARRRFLRQAQAMAGVSHDHIVPVYHVDECEGLPFLVMPRLEGESLADLLGRQTTLGGAELARIGREIAAGLAAAHRHGLLHRDLRPECIWLEGPQQRVKILEFGLFRPAVVTGDAADAVPASLAYLSPEQANGKTGDERSDLYSLGCILYACATGRAPLKGESLLGALVSLQLHSPAPVTPAQKDLPEGLANLIERLMSKEPEKRPVSAAAVEAELLAIHERTLKATDQFETVIERREPSAAAPGPERFERHSAQRGHQRIWIAIALAFAVLSAALALKLVMRKEQPARVTVGTQPGDYASLSQAFAAVAPGGEVILRPGQYAESIVLDKPVTLRGDGSPNQVVITANAQAAIEAAAPNIALLGLTIQGGNANAIHVRQGSVVARDCLLSNQSSSAAVVYAEGSASQITFERCRIGDSLNAGIVAENKATVNVNDCDLIGNALAGVDGRTQATINLKCCRIQMNRAAGLILVNHCQAQLQDCDIWRNGSTGAEISRDAAATFQRCRIHDHQTSCGLYFYHNGRGKLENCEIFLNHTSGIEITAHSLVELIDCAIHCNTRHGIDLYRRGEVHLKDCTLKDNVLGPIHSEPDCKVVESK